MDKVNYKSDFSLRVSLKDIMGGLAAFSDLTEYRLEFRTDNGVVYTAGHFGGVYHNCAPRHDGALVYFDNHGLGCGKLRGTFYLYAPSDEYPDGNLLTTAPVDCDVELVYGKTELPMDGSAVVEIPSAFIHDTDVYGEVIADVNVALDRLLNGKINTAYNE